MSLLYYYLRLSQNPGMYTSLNEELTNNKSLNKLMVDKNVCNLVRTEKYYIDDTQSSSINPCSDSFKALIGALYIYFKNLNMDYIENIKYWLLKNTQLPFLIYQTFVDMNIKSLFPVYFVNNRKYLKDLWIKEYSDLLE